MCNKFLAAYSTNKIISFPNSEMPTYAITSRWTTCTTHDIYMFIKDGMGHIFWKSRQSRHSCLGWENVTSDVQHIAAHMHKVKADIAMDAKISFSLLWSGLANRCRRGGSACGFQSSIVVAGCKLWCGERLLKDVTLHSRAGSVYEVTPALVRARLVACLTRDASLWGTSAKSGEVAHASTPWKAAHLALAHARRGRFEAWVRIIGGWQASGRCEGRSIIRGVSKWNCHHARGNHAGRGGNATDASVAGIGVEGIQLGIHREWSAGSVIEPASKLLLISLDALFMIVLKCLLIARDARPMWSSTEPVKFINPPRKGKTDGHVRSTRRQSYWDPSLEYRCILRILWENICINLAMVLQRHSFIHGLLLFLDPPGGVPPTLWMWVEMSSLYPQINNKHPYLSNCRHTYWGGSTLCPLNIRYTCSFNWPRVSMKNGITCSFHPMYIFCKSPRWQQYAHTTFLRVSQKILWLELICEGIWPLATSSSVRR